MQEVTSSFLCCDVNNIVPLPVTDDLYLVASGGDDGSIHVAKIKIVFEEYGKVCVSVASSYHHDSAHAAQITGIW